MAINNESIGISAEVAIAKSFDLEINPNYVARSEKEIVDLLLENDNIQTIFTKEKIPTPKRHIAENQNPVDFELYGNKTLSVKTNQNDIGRAAPQNIGQPTQITYFRYIQNNNIIPGFDINDALKNAELEDTYENRGKIFKCLSIQYIDVLINMYWKNMFDCDYLILFYNLENHANPLSNYRIFGKKGALPVWDKNKFSFTQTKDSWNESNTLKYCNISIGNFQVHQNRDCFKFRFDMKGIMKLINDKLI